MTSTVALNKDVEFKLKKTIKQEIAALSWKTYWLLQFCGWVLGIITGFLLWA